MPVTSFKVHLPCETGLVCETQEVFPVLEDGAGLCGLRPFYTLDLAGNEHLQKSTEIASRVRLLPVSASQQLSRSPLYTGTLGAELPSGTLT